ncbi:MAG: VPLPA-CTERM-specific exosortase XrtD [Thiotrichales bacterium]|nr:VPLPA-CTERM-specific exosortase XrtD [Thiotrichales bacterium]
MITLAVISLFIIFWDSLVLMEKWWQRDEYSHGYMLPLVAGYFIWQKQRELLTCKFEGSWPGIFLVAIGIFVGYIGIKSTIYTVQQYGFLISLYGIFLAVMGKRAMSIIWAPLLLLLFMVPLPNFIYNNLSQKLQLVSSAIGVGVIRLFDISVFLEGNVIDLGNYKLQVVDACSGLRYLFPLMSFGFICAYLFNAPLWQRVLVFITTIPITVLMNSFRIGVIGVLVNYWGIEQAEGFLHDFEGWIIFMACVGVLFVEMWLLTIFRKDRPPFREVFGLTVPPLLNDDAEKSDRIIERPVHALVPLVLLGILFMSRVDMQDLNIPDRSEFVVFPDQLGDWNGKRSSLEQIYIDGLAGMTDYIISDYVNGDSQHVSLYSAYYEIQSSGSSIHSPASCIPGGGWKIHGLEERQIDDIRMSGQPLKVNRVLIQLGNQKQLVYYWFLQRGRVMTNEYLVKWYLLQDSIIQNRTDGALVRVTTRVKPGQEIIDADHVLQNFTKLLIKELVQFVPD